MEQNKSSGRTSRIVIVSLIILVVVVLGLLLLPYVIFFVFADFETINPTREAIENPGAEFTQFTGLKWPESANVITVGDTHGGFHGNGEFYLVCFI